MKSLVIARVWLTNPDGGQISQELPVVLEALTERDYKAQIGQVLEITKLTLPVGVQMVFQVQAGDTVTYVDVELGMGEKTYQTRSALPNGGHYPASGTYTLDALELTAKEWV